MLPMTSIPFSCPTSPARSLSLLCIAELSPGPSIRFQSVDPHLKSIAVIKRRSRRMSVTMRSVICDPFALGIWWYFVSVGALQKGIQHTFWGVHINFSLLWFFFPFPFWMNLKCVFFDLTLTDDEGFSKSVIFLCNIFWWNASFFKEKIFFFCQPCL